MHTDSVTATALRAAFPVLDESAYLNAGTCGPLPAVAAEAASASIAWQARHGRSGDYYLRLIPRIEELRGRYAALLGARPEDVAVTAGTSDGIARVLAGMTFEPGDEIVTADDEHPGLYGPLIGARDRFGVTIRAVPLPEIAGAVSSRTRLVACSHVAWLTGAHAPLDALRVACGDRVPLLLDGAQSAGAVPADVRALGATWFAGSGQKWLCGAVGTGMLWTAPAWRDRLATPLLHYGALDEPVRGLAARPAADARRFDATSLELTAIEMSIAAFDVLAAAGWQAVHDAAAAGAEELAAALTARGQVVAPRGPGPLVAWDAGSDEAAVALRDRATAAGVAIRDLPGTGRVRASVGAWNDAQDRERLLALLTS